MKKNEKFEIFEEEAELFRHDNIYFKVLTLNGKAYRLFGHNLISIEFIQNQQ